jgi:hypothetical protein
MASEYSDCVEKVLVLSTSHVPDAWGKAFKEFGDSIRWQEHEYGWIVWVLYYLDEDELGYGLPQWIRPIWRIAQSEKCSMILFDRDADEIDGVKTYDW